MPFTLETGMKIREHYAFLIGLPLDKHAPFEITDILLVPAAFGEYTKFMEAFKSNRNGATAISMATTGDAFDILLMHYTTDNTSLLKKELGMYLDEFKLERVY